MSTCPEDVGERQMLNGYFVYLTRSVGFGIYAALFVNNLKRFLYLYSFSSFVIWTTLFSIFFFCELRFSFIINNDYRWFFSFLSFSLSEFNVLLFQSPCAYVIHGQWSNIKCTNAGCQSLSGFLDCASSHVICCFFNGKSRLQSSNYALCISDFFLFLDSLLFFHFDFMDASHLAMVFHLRFIYVFVRRYFIIH